MSETAMLSVLGVVCATLFGLLCGLLGYGGNKLILKMDQLYDRMDNYVSNIHVRINGIDTRLTIIETRRENRHDDP
jgi:hypothetical protein